MIVLALETSMGRTSVALGRPNRPPAVLRLAEGRSQAEHLVSLIGELMQTQGAGFHELDRIAVCTGPGGFSGVRTGIAAARGIGAAAKKTVVGATSFDLIAFAFLRAHDRAFRHDHFAIVAPAGSGLYFVQLRDNDGMPSTAIEVVEPLEARAKIKDRAGVVCGPNPHALEVCGVGELAFDGGDVSPSADDLAAMAPDLDPTTHVAAPFYIRAPDARPQTRMRIVRKASWAADSDYI